MENGYASAEKRTWRTQAIADAAGDACILFFIATFAQVYNFSLLKLLSTGLYHFFCLGRGFLSLALRALPGCGWNGRSMRGGHRCRSPMSSIQDTMRVVLFLFGTLRAGVGGIGRRRRARAPRVGVGVLSRRRGQRCGVRRGRAR